jgi:hypothetical protein
MYSTPSARRSGFPFLELMGSVLILAATVLLVNQMTRFSQVRQQLPSGLELGSVPVGGLSRPEAQAYVEQVYGRPISVRYMDQEIRLTPDEVGFRVNSDVMLSKADEIRTEGAFWSGFWDYIWLRPEQTSSVPLSAEYSDEMLRAWLNEVASRYDRPPTPPQPDAESMTFDEGQVGYRLDIEASYPLIAEALVRPANREVELVVDTEAPQASEGCMIC